MKIHENISLKPFNTFKVDVQAKYLIEIESVADIDDFCHSENYTILPRMFLGGGSNVLFTKDYTGVILRSAIKDIEQVFEDENDVWLRAGSGLVWDKFVGYCVERNLGGIENLSDIPGCVGASPVQNIGAYGVEAKDRIIKVECTNIEENKSVLFENAACKFSYRSSIFKQPAYNKYFITHVTFRLSKNPVIISNYGTVEQELSYFRERTIQNLRKAIIKIRQSKLPSLEEYGSAGSFFKNPVISIKDAEKLLHEHPDAPYYKHSDDHVKIPAAWLIEHTGLKGYRHGECGTYKKQPLVIVNYGKAAGSELAEFSKTIREKVFNKFSIMLEPEVCFI